ncbi:MAG: NADH-quinone oxidoreductase subunit NuoE [Anaerolineae bacterium]|nr:NADH-quinone oxidoreductase subunit NuoE [Anaerolineales bacterium]MCQ3979194.1 NADH-quinone oxidoreductase subunit NuoE [Anaerolineae bacterium]
MNVDAKNKSDIPSIVQAAIAQHGTTPEALVPLLSEVNEKLGYLPTAALTEISRALRLPGSQLMAVASFYRMLSIKPRGRHVIQFCESAPCHVMGGRLVRRVLQEELGLEPGETSADGQWTLLAVSCPGICGVGPVLMIDENIYGNITPRRIREILREYEVGSKE